MSTLYEALEVSEKASKEVIEKAYRVLAKKYHPDLQTPQNQAMAEARMKQINEAYDILGDDDKRKKYDEELRVNRQEEENLRKQQDAEQQFYNQNRSNQHTDKRDINYEQKSNQNVNYQQQNHPNVNYQQQMSYQEKQYQDLQKRKYEEELRKYQEQRQRQMEQQYENAYYDYLRSMGFRIRERWTWKKTKQLLMAIGIMILIGLTLWIIPPTHDMMVNLYEDNIFIRAIVNTIAAIFKGIWTTLQGLFTKK